MPDFGNVDVLHANAASYGAEDQNVDQAQAFLQAMAVRMATNDGVVDTADERKGYEDALVRIANQGDKPTTNIDYSVNAEEAQGLVSLELAYTVGNLNGISAKSQSEQNAIKQGLMDQAYNAAISDGATIDVADRVKANTGKYFNLYVELDAAGKGYPADLPGGATGPLGNNLLGVTSANHINYTRTDNPVIAFLDNIVKAEPYAW